MKQTYMFFWNSLAFSIIQRMLAIWSLVPLPFLNPVCTSGSCWFTYYWSITWRILSLTMLMWNECNCTVVWTYFGIALLWNWNENWPFSGLWPLLFSKFAGMLSAAVSFRIWNSSVGSSSPPLAVFIVMLPKAHLTSPHSRMSDSSWVTTLLWLSGSFRPF